MKTSRDEIPAAAAQTPDRSPEVISVEVSGAGRPRQYATAADRKAAYRERERARADAAFADLEALLRAARNLCYAHDLPAHGVPDVIASLTHLAQEVEALADRRQRGAGER